MTQPRRICKVLHVLHRQENQHNPTKRDHTNTRIHQCIFVSSITKSICYIVYSVASVSCVHFSMNHGFRRLKRVFTGVYSAYRDHFCSQGLTLIPTWIRNHTPSYVWDEIAFPHLNFSGCTVEVWWWISNFIPQFIMDVITYSWWNIS